MKQIQHWHHLSFIQLLSNFQVLVMYTATCHCQLMHLIWWSSVLFSCLIFATRVVHTCTHGYPHRKNHRVWCSVIWLARRCDHHSQFVGLRSAHYSMHKQWTSSLVMHFIAARTRQAAVLVNVGRQSFLAYMISGCHHCICIEIGTYQMIMQQATLTRYL